MLKHLFTPNPWEPSNQGSHDMKDFIPYNENELAAILGGGEESRPYVSIPKDQEQNNNEGTRDLQ